MERSADTGSYGQHRAAGFDQEAQFNIGNRQQQYAVLTDILKYMRTPKLEFCDLGCGTGFFTNAFFEVAPDSHGIAIDASPEMLKVACERLAHYGSRLNFACLRFQEIDWSDFANRFTVVFSSLAIHHLADQDKWKLFKDIFDCLRPGGWFILYDLYRCPERLDTGLIEYLACADMQRRIVSQFELEFIPEELEIEQLITKDRSIRSEDGDKEAILEEQLARLKRAGFSSTILVFLESRIAGIACRKCEAE